MSRREQIYRNTTVEATKIEFSHENEKNKAKLSYSQNLKSKCATFAAIWWQLPPFWKQKMAYMVWVSLR